MLTGSLPVLATLQHAIIERYGSPGLCQLLPEIRQMTQASFCSAWGLVTPTGQRAARQRGVCKDRIPSQDKAARPPGAQPRSPVKTGQN